MLTLKRIVVLASVLFCPLGGEAQTTPTMANAKLAAIEAVKASRSDSNTTRYVSDSAEFWDTYTRCRQVNGKRACTLVTDYHITWVRVDLTAPTEAQVSVRDMGMVYATCPVRTPIVPPIVSATAVQLFKMRFDGTVWIADKRWSRMAC